MPSESVSKISAIIQLIRPAHWAKNGFVLAPLLFSKTFTEPQRCFQAVLAVMSFSLVASAIYAVNDLFDRAEDRAHPVKRQRPLATGDLSAREALLTAVALLAGGVGCGLYLNCAFLAWLGIYAGLCLIYSAGLKHVVIVDVMVIAAGFVLRILGGAAAITVVPSHWLLLCAMMISLFLGFTKRRAEMTDGKQQAADTRHVLKDYSVGFLDQAIAMMTTATLVCYALYTVDEQTVNYFGTRGLLLTVPLVIYGLFRYLYLIYHLRQGQDATASLCRDWPSLINLLLWVLVVVLVLHHHIPILMVSE